MRRPSITYPGGDSVPASSRSGEPAAVTAGGCHPLVDSAECDRFPARRRAKDAAQAATPRSRRDSAGDDRRGAPGRRFVHLEPCNKNFAVAIADPKIDQGTADKRCIRGIQPPMTNSWPHEERGRLGNAEPRKRGE